MATPDGYFYWRWIYFNTRSDTSTKMSSTATFVLVHGSCHGGLCWQKVTSILRKQGHEVYTPTLTGLGERSHLLREDIDLDTHI
jgi:hypothetical protein